MNVILRTWFQTGLGDFYACLLSTKIAHDKLKSNGFNVTTIITYDYSHYGNEEQTKLLHDCFDLSNFDVLLINSPIPENYEFFKNIQWAYEIYTLPNNNYELLHGLELYGYSVENIFKGQPLPEINFRKSTLFNSQFLTEIQTISEKLGKFITIFYRYSDSHVPSNDEIKTIYDKILSISTEHNDYNIFISCKISEINEIKIPNQKIVRFEYEINNHYDRVKRDLINMSLFMFSDKIYFSISHWSNYMTLSLIHNKLNKNYDEFLFRI